MSKESDLIEMLKQELATTTLKSIGRSGGGCISEGSTYITDRDKVFIKINKSEGALKMFEGESASLTAIASTKTVKVPEPLRILPYGNGAVFVMENLDIVSGLSHHSATLGEQIARLHLKNQELIALEAKTEKSVHKAEREEKAVKKFGFEVNTCCGIIPQDNTWRDTWPELYARKIEQQLCLIDTEYSDREVRELWSQLMPKLPRFFDGAGDIKPSLLHGDLWNGNVAEIEEGPVVFDPSSFYGHSEFDLGISKLFSGFRRQFFDSYFKVLPKLPGYDNRLELYKLFHYLNHWNHFGTSYKGSSVRTLHMLVRIAYGS